MFEFIYKDIDFAHKVDEASNPTEQYAKHIHPFNEIVLFITGDVVYTVETESRTLQPGDIVFIPSGKYHFATVNKDAKYERYVLKFPDKFLPDYIKEKQEIVSCFLGSAKRHFDVFHAFDEFRTSYSDEELYTLYMCETIRLLVDLYHEPSPIIKEAPPIVNELIYYINNHLDEREAQILSLRYGLSGEEPKTQRETAQALGISRSYISRIEKKALETLRRVMEDI
jgi:RNA polymerase sigma factor (sigma-70 family)